MNIKAPWFTSLTHEQQVVYLTRIGISTDAKGCDGVITKEIHEMAYMEAMGEPEIIVERPTPHEDLFGHTPPAAPLPRDVRMQRAFDKLREDVG